MAEDISRIPEELLSAPSTESLSISLVDLSLDGDGEVAVPSDATPDEPRRLAKPAPQPSKLKSPANSSSSSPITKRRPLNFSVVPVSSPNRETTPARLNHGGLGKSSPVLSPPKERSASNSSGEASLPGDAVPAGAAMAAAREQDSLLSKYLSELATKESHVSGLKQRVAELKVAVAEAEREAKVAETDLVKFKQSGNSFMDKFRSQSPSLRHQSIAELSEGALHHRTSRSPSPRRPPPPPQQQAPHEKRESDMLIMGKRVVDEINHQFWSFVEDVKTATIGPDDDYDGTPPPAQPPRPAEGRGRPAAPRLKPKQSLSNMVESIRKLSPERRPAPRPEGSKRKMA